RRSVSACFRVLPRASVRVPLPRADPDRPVGRGAVGGPRARPDDRRRDPLPHPGGGHRHGGAPPLGVDGMKRVLLTGVSSFWGARLARALEADESIETIIGVSTQEPPRLHDCTEFVRLRTA